MQSHLFIVIAQGKEMEMEMQILNGVRKVGIS